VPRTRGASSRSADEHRALFVERLAQIDPAEHARIERGVGAQPRAQRRRDEIERGPQHGAVLEIDDLVGAAGEETHAARGIDDPLRAGAVSGAGADGPDLRDLEPRELGEARERRHDTRALGRELRGGAERDRGATRTRGRVRAANERRVAGRGRRGRRRAHGALHSHARSAR
jgi:hypothetical protein